jgi:uncharacterized protein (DUF2141 family)
MRTTKRLLFGSLLATAALASAGVAVAEGEVSSSGGNLSVGISNIPNDQGQVGCSLFARKDGFPSNAARAEVSMFVKPKAGKARCTFKNLKPGKYAVAVMHDADRDGKLKTSMVGRPQEWWGVSNNIPAERFGPPKYEAAVFDFRGSAKAIQIRLRR